MYDIIFAPKVAKEIEKIPEDDLGRIRKAIRGLKENPRPHGCRKLTSLRGLFRVRCGDYRIVYLIEDEKVTILIVSVKHRKDVYRDF